MVAGSVTGILFTAVGIPMMLPAGKRRPERAERGGVGVILH